MIQRLHFSILLALFTLSAAAQTNILTTTLKVGAERTELYLPLLKNKNIAIVANQTSMLENTHLVDSLLALGIHIKKVFSPEHGFRGNADAGEHLKTYRDKKTGMLVVSLYGKNTKPTTADMKDIDIVIYDIQDVGVRFYTYLSTLNYIMEACAENNKQLIVLDRPNPNGYYIDGPVLEEKYKSFVGLHPIPIVYGMTVAEYAQMLNGEAWLKEGKKCNLICITVQGYTHNSLYELPIKPSPNLPNITAIYLYPSLALFEGTVISVGRGTDKPFELIGHPKLQNAKFTFTPRSIPGASKEPLYKGEICYGHDLSNFGQQYIKSRKQIYLYWLQATYSNTLDKATFFNDYFNSLVGNATLKQQIIAGIDEAEIRKSWEPLLTQFKNIRKKYLLYPDFD